MNGSGSKLARLLAKYNYFHDGILKAVKFSASDGFSGKSHSLTITGLFKAVLDIAHYNFRDNLDRKPLRFRFELEEAGPFSFCSNGETGTPNHWALRKVLVRPVKNKPGKLRLELLGDKYSVKAGKWVGIRLAVIEFATYKVKIS